MLYGKPARFEPMLTYHRKNRSLQAARVLKLDNATFRKRLSTMQKWIYYP